METIHDICKRYNIKNYTVNDDGSIDVDGNVDLSWYRLTELPLTFNKVTGYFDCGVNNLTTLKGCPRWVGGYFNCEDNQLTSLEFSPDYIGGYFSCSCNQLTSLEFSPDYVGDSFDCDDNYLTDNYCDTEIGGKFYTSLKQDGLTKDNYNEWRKLYKRKQILDDIFNM
jgi:hypothetical protein